MEEHLGLRLVVYEKDSLNDNDSAKREDDGHSRIVRVKVFAGLSHQIHASQEEEAPQKIISYKVHSEQACTHEVENQDYLYLPVPNVGCQVNRNYLKLD